MDPVRKVWKADGRYRLEAYQFLFDALDKSVRLAGKEEAQGPERHISGQELLAGMRQHAIDLFGPLAAQVWRTWGIESTIDWGRIVFALVEAKLLNRQETDTIDDFANGYDFDEAFVNHYRPELPRELGVRPARDGA